MDELSYTEEVRKGERKVRQTLERKRGSMSEFCDEDPWASISAVEIQKTIDRSITEAPTFKKILVDVIDGKKPLDEAEEWLCSESSEEIFCRLLKKSPTWVIRCHVTDSMASGEWGLKTFTIGGKGYIYSRPDEDEPCIIGAWAPARDQQRYRRSLLSVYKSSWESCPLPPMMSQWVDGPFEVIFDGICAALRQKPKFWDVVLRTLREPDKRGMSSAELVRKTSKCVAKDSRVVHPILQSLSTRDDPARLNPNSIKKGDSRILVTAFLTLIKRAY